MKKIIMTTMIIIIMIFSIFSIKVYADTLDSIDVTIDKEKIRPGESIILNVAFGQELGAYTVEVEYDSKLVKFDSAEGGTANDTTGKVIVTFYDAEGGRSPRNNMHLTFKANEEGIVASNPTQFKVTMKGMTSPDSHTSYEDITQPYTKSFIVEPEYEDYKMSLDYKGDILPGKEKDMKIIITSAMGQNYEHTRINASVTGPKDSTVKLLGIDNGVEHDIIQSGWGKDEGDPLGGEEVEKVLDVRGLFSKEGTYTLKLDLVDRDTSDEIISTKTFQIVVGDKKETTEDDEKQTTGGNTEEPKTETKEPEKLPDTGNMMYARAFILGVTLLGAYGILKKRK